MFKIEPEPPVEDPDEIEEITGESTEDTVKDEWPDWLPYPED